MFDANSLFVIPEEMMNRVPCQTSPELYEDSALDVDFDDDDFVLLSRNDQLGRLAAKEQAEARAVSACQACPMVTACKEWATNMGQDVFGVVGGLTQAERPNHVNIAPITDYTERGPLGQVRDDLIERWAAAGIPNKQIAERLGCNVRTVERRRAGMAAGKIVPFNPEEVQTPKARVTVPASAGAVTATKLAVLAPNPETAAKIPLLVQRVTEETAAIYDALADGRFHDRAEIIEAAIPYVEKALALKTAPKGRKYADEAAQVAVGARKFILNRLDIAIRRGRIQSVSSDSGRVLVCLEPETAKTWTGHRNLVAV